MLCLRFIYNNTTLHKPVHCSDSVNILASFLCELLDSDVE